MENNELFWHSLFTSWDDHYSILHRVFLESSDEQFTRSGEILKLVLKKINKLLPDDLAARVEIIITFGEKNNIYLADFKDIAELYISPRLDRENMSYVETLYDSFSSARNKYAHLSKFADKLYITKYRPFNKAHTKIETIEIDAENKKFVNLCDIGYQKNIGLLNNKPVFHIIIGVREPTAKLLEKRTIKFDTGKEREIYVFPGNILEIILENYIGECNLINYIGYIEVMPEDKISLKKNFYEISKLIEEIDIIKNNQSIKACKICGANILISKLYRCSRCKNIYYCSTLCQKIDKDNHAEFCKIKNN